MPNFPNQYPANLGVIYLDYLVYFRDPAECTAARDLAGGYGMLRRPDFVRNLFSIPDNVGGWDPAVNTWIQYPIFAALFTQPSGPWVPKQIQFPIDWPIPAQFYVFDEDWFIVPGQDVPGLGQFPDMVFIWSAMFLSAGGGQNTTEDELLDFDFPITERRWVTGFELPNGAASSSMAEGGTGVSEFFCRDSSRTPDGIGIAFRGSQATIINRTVAQYGVPTFPKLSWERLYVRLRKRPTAGSHSFWRCLADNGTGAEGATLRINTSGQVELYSVDNLGTATLRDTGNTLSTNQWTRLDILIEYKSDPAPPGTLLSVQVFGGGVDFTDIEVNAATSTLVHGSSIIGNNMTGANDMELDYDTWINTDHPSSLILGNRVLELDRMDWVFGSNAQRIRTIDFGPNNNAVAWTGNFRSFAQNPSQFAQAGLQSGTSGARLEAETESDTNPSGIFGTKKQLGAAAFVVGLGSQGAGLTGTLGYKIGADVSAIITEGGGLAWNSALYHPAGNVVPASIAPLLLFHNKSTDATVNTVRLLQAVCEFLGTWGSVDDVNPSTPGSLSDLGIHNGPFLYTFLSNVTPPPFNFIGVQGGTYVGNGTGQDITLGLPTVHWLWIRSLSANGGGTRWFSSMLGTHGGVNADSITTDLMVEAFIEENDITAKLRITGDHARANQLGVTYQFVAFSDSAMRAVVNGAFKHRSSVASIANSLVPTGFLPEAAFLFEEILGSTPGSAGLWFKGAGHQADGASKVGAAETTDVVTFATGSIGSETNIHSDANSQVAFSAWKQKPTDAEDPTLNAVYIGQYTGDGAADRTITVDINGRRPLWAIITPMNAQSWVRDPSNVGTDSNNAALTTNGATSIKGGGINQVLIGITLNALGVVYSIFVIPGSDVAGENGWSVNGTFPVAPGGWFNPPPEFLTPPDIPADITVIGEGGIVFGGEAPRLLLLDVSGIYTLVPGKRHDTLQDRQVGQTEVDVPIPDPVAKTGFIGG